MERLFLLSARSRGLPVWMRYGATTLLVLTCLGLRLWIFGRQPGLPFLFFFPAVIIAGIVFDRGTGIYAGLLSGALAVLFLFEPLGVFSIARATDLLSLFLFLAIALFTALVMEALHVALRRLAQERADLASANAELAKMAEARGTLLSEAVHRARNDLQRLAATLHLQAGMAEPEARQALQDASGRIMALARINARLDRHRNDGQAVVNSRGFLEGLVQDLRDAVADLRPVALLVQAEDHAVPMARAVPIGLMVNELVGNALKYAFPGEMEGRVQVLFRREAEDFLLAVEDNGIGLDPAAPPPSSGLGTRISRALAGQLGGTLTPAPANPGGNRPGLRWSVRFPVA
jgi:two-component system, sensor histidine kinase PdtaS